MPAAMDISTPQTFLSKESNTGAPWRIRPFCTPGALLPDGIQG